MLARTGEKRDLVSKERLSNLEEQLQQKSLIYTTRRRQQNASETEEEKRIAKKKKQRKGLREKSRTTLQKEKRD